MPSSHSRAFVCDVQKAAKVVDGPQTEVVTQLINCMLPGSKISKFEKPTKLMDKKVMCPLLLFI